MLRRRDWFYSEDRKRDLAITRPICDRLAPRSDGMLAEEMAWLLYQQRVLLKTQIERKLREVLR